MRFYFGFVITILALCTMTNGCSGDMFVVAPIDGESETGIDDSGFDAETSMIDVSADEGGETGGDGGPVIPDSGPPNVTFDTIAMGCFKAVVIENVSKKVVWGSASSATCLTKLPDIFVPSAGYTLIVWVKDPTNNLLSFNSSVTFTVTKARCSAYATAPTWAQLENDFSTQTFVAISNAATLPSYLFTKSCAGDAEYLIHQ